jgi:1-deoxy-D-xylulose-5-phosphate reductoisomerase
LTRNSPDKRRLIVLGSTGSIGVSTLSVVEHLTRSGAMQFEVVGLAAGANADLLHEQASRFAVRHIAIADARQTKRHAETSSVYSGPDSAIELIAKVSRPGDLVVAAMVGSAGIPAVMAAIERGCDIALANKETLVAAGALVMPKVHRQGVDLLPVDSEHSAIFQCLEGCKTKGDLHGPDSIRRIVITASGGPFRTWSPQRMHSATVEDALNHPTWNMGPKVTIDSASLMNKALEIIEAHWLFGLPADKIRVIIHPQSIIHSFVEFVDGSVLAQLGPPDMRTPIQYALTWPSRSPGVSRAMNWDELRRMDFEPIEESKFIAPRLAYAAIEAGWPGASALPASPNWFKPRCRRLSQHRCIAWTM